MDAYHVAPVTDADADEADLYEPEEGERVDYRTNLFVEECAACRRGDCVQAVVTDRDSETTIVVHGQRKAVMQ